jgi:hypothetical protein
MQWLLCSTVVTYYYYTKQVSVHNTLKLQTKNDHKQNETLKYATKVILLKPCQKGLCDERHTNP